MSLVSAMVDVTTPMPPEILPAILAKAAVRSTNPWARPDSKAPSRVAPFW